MQRNEASFFRDQKSLFVGQDGKPPRARAVPVLSGSTSITLSTYSSTCMLCLDYIHCMLNTVYNVEPSKDIPYSILRYD